MTHLGQPGATDQLLDRLGRLTPESTRQWGQMTPHEMLCHLADSYRACLGERQVSHAQTWVMRNIGKYVALRTSMPWPKGVPTRPEVDAKDKGTRPTTFEQDRAAVIELVHRFTKPDIRYAQHPIFGTMSREDWLIWAWKHPDHHLRQFGL